MNKFFEALANIFRIPDLRKRVLFTLALLAVYRIGAYIPTPGIDYDPVRRVFQPEARAASSAISICSAAACCAA